MPVISRSPVKIADRPGRHERCITTRINKSLREIQNKMSKGFLIYSRVTGGGVRKESEMFKKVRRFKFFKGPVLLNVFTITRCLHKSLGGILRLGNWLFETQFIVSISHRLMWNTDYKPFFGLIAGSGRNKMYCTQAANWIIMVYSPRSFVQYQGQLPLSDYTLHCPIDLCQDTD